MADVSDFRNRTLYSLGMAAVGLACLWFEAATLALIALLVVAFTWEVVRALINQPHGVGGTAITLTFGLIGLSGFGFALHLRTEEHGFYTLILIALSVIATDTFAYVIGKKFGEIHFAPKVSPNKTLEGVLWGMFMGEMVFLLTWLVLELNHKASLSLTGFVVLTLGVPLAAVCGDLLGSLAKRKLGLKDYSSLLGGHGGVADRFDGMTAAFVVYGLVSILTA